MTNLGGIAGLWGGFQKRMWLKIASINKKNINISSLPPMVSFTFDDAPVSSFVNGGAVLEQFGFNGTYYVAAGLMGKITNVGQIADMEIIAHYGQRGHEIGNHTFDHMDCLKAGIESIKQNIQMNRSAMNSLISNSFAYPYGSRDARTRFAISRCTDSARGISFGINKGLIDLWDLKAAQVYSQNSMDDCFSLVSECAANGGWLIFYTHDVNETPSAYGCKPEEFTQLVKAVRNNYLTVATVEKATAIVKAFRRS
ncbi:MAG TPA: hypothetical protein DCR95_02515 [Desulfobacter sp.]|nr:hypothetical protein [Desulfobacter sp.]